jgi:hypothetical protein
MKLALLATYGAAACAAVLSVPGSAHAARTLTRNYEPVVIVGSQTPDLLGTSVTKIVVFKFVEASGTWVQIPFQIDERTAGGDFFTADDGLWDTNDQLAFMAQDCGDQAFPTQWAPGTNQTTRQEVVVTDPLTGNVAWAYVYTAPSVTPVSTMYMTYSGTSSNTITGQNYQIDFLDGKPNIQTAMRITPAGGGDATDLLDRSKARITIRVIFDLKYTEEDLNSTIVGTKLGPVRFIERFTSTLTGFNALDATAYYYPGFIRTFTTIISNFFDLRHLRYSFDFNESVTGMKHYDDNGASGNGPLMIDGTNDPASKTPLGQWWEVDSSHGCYIVIGDYSAAPVGSMSGFYQDGGSDPDGSSTGSDGLWGESGAVFDNAQSTQFTVDAWSFMLPANQGNVGNAYESFYRNQLVVAPGVQSFATGVREPGRNELPGVAALGAASPSPFSRRTVIPVQLYATPTQTRVEITTPDGRLVRALDVQANRLGRTDVAWDGRDGAGRSVAQGVYLYRLVTPAGATGAGRVLVVR